MFDSDSFDTTSFDENSFDFGSGGGGGTPSTEVSTLTSTLGLLFSFFVALFKGLS